MGTEASSTSANPAEASTTLGVGGATSGQAGSTPSRETQAETGGSGGAGLTHSHGEEAGAPAGQAGVEHGGAGAAPAPKTALESGARGAQDTRGAQGGGTGTGLGVRESGANQSEDDLPPSQPG